MDANAADDQHLLSPFEGREAIYIEKAALHVRVYDIRLTKEEMCAGMQELPTPGLGFARAPYNLSGQKRPYRWRISTSEAAHPFFSSHCWDGGAQVGWSPYFDPEIVSGAVKLAARFPPTLPFVEGYDQIVKFVLEPYGRYAENQRLLLFRE